MVGRVESDLVDAVAVVVVRVEHGLVFVGLKAQLNQLAAAGERAKGLQFGLGPSRAFSGHGLAQGNVLLVGIEVAQRRWLVFYGVGFSQKPVTCVLGRGENHK